MSDINYIRQAKRSIAKGDLSSAKIAIKSALIQHPNHYEALILDYDIARVEKNITEQKAKLKRLIKQKPEMLQFSIELAKIYIDTKQYEKAPKVFEPLFKLFNHPDLFFNHAWFLTRTAEYQKAICQYEKAIELNVSFKEEVYLNIANILSTWLKEPDKARDYLNKALTINPRYIDAIYNLANLEEDLGHRSKAIALFKKVIDLNPLHGSASARLALASDDENCGDLIYNVEDLIKNSKLINSKIHFGGPVNLDTGFFLHKPNYQTDKTLNISNNLSLTADEKVMQDIEHDSGPNDFIFTLGYAGWGKNQLQDEIKNGDWLIIPVPEDIKSIFDIGILSRFYYCTK